MSYWFRYTDGTTKIFEFNTQKDAAWFAYNEGDHLVEWGIKE